MTAFQKSDLLIQATLEIDTYGFGLKCWEIWASVGLKSRNH